ncbi:hypothetical protein A4X13_0g4627 [Tilletia indica]|uniref:Uncharacterized protein n=1 Tax=Tilletia indica TaxID=43049 RepID=A0A8T8SX45_9BASI|nr:hypothetical protein A4X13_0g4627 [Tilletia indica]
MSSQQHHPRSTTPGPVLSASRHMDAVNDNLGHYGGSYSPSPSSLGPSSGPHRDYHHYHHPGHGVPFAGSGIHHHHQQPHQQAAYHSGSGVHFAAPGTPSMHHHPPSFVPGSAPSVLRHGPAGYDPAYHGMASPGPLSTPSAASGPGSVLGPIGNVVGTVIPKAVIPKATTRKTGPTDKTIATNYLSEYHVIAKMETEIQKRVEAKVASVLQDVNVVAREQVNVVLDNYAAAVEGFRAKVLQINGDGADAGLQRSDDGNIYIRINHHNLESYFSKVNDVERVLQQKIDTLTADMEALQLKVDQSAQSAPSLAPSSGGPGAVGPSAPPTLPTLNFEGKEHKWTRVQNKFKALISQQAGLPSGRGAADKEQKIYEVPFPTDPADIIYHPHTYVPTSDQPAPESSAAGDARRRYRCLRFDFDRNWDEDPNWELLLPILEYLLRDFEDNDLPKEMTPKELMRKVLKRTWMYWRERFRQLRAGSSFSEVKEGWAQDNQESRRSKRTTNKGGRRYRVAKSMLVGKPGHKNFDALDPCVFRGEYQSAEESVAESVPGTPTKKRFRIRRAPEFRSDEGDRYLRGLDANLPLPRDRIVDSDERFPTPTVPAEARMWMISAQYASNNPEAVAHLLPNRGPFSGDGMMASSSNMIGSTPIPSVLSSLSTTGRASGSSSAAAASSAYRRLFASEPQDAVVGGLPAGAGVGVGEEPADVGAGADAGMGVGGDAVVGEEPSGVGMDMGSGQDAVEGGELAGS